MEHRLIAWAEQPSAGPTESPKQKPLVPEKEVEKRVLTASETAEKQAVDRVRSEHDADVKAYHQKYLYKPGQKEDLKGNSIFRVKLSDHPNPKGTIVLFLGNMEPLDDATGVDTLRESNKKKQKPASEIRDRLEADGDYNVVMIRTTHVPGNAPGLSAPVIEAHATQLVSDITARRGVFSQLRGEDSLNFFGFSYGGGLMQRVVDQWDTVGGKAVVGKTAAIDPVQFGSMAKASDRRPARTQGHLQIFQRSNGFANVKGAAPLSGGWDTRVDRTTERKDKTHFTIHDAKASPDITADVYHYLTGRDWKQP